MLHATVLFAVLLGLWLMISGINTPLFWALGIVSSAIAVWIARRKSIIDRESVPLQLHPLRFPAYLAWLLVEIIKANWDVTRRILSPSLPISPTVATLPAPGDDLLRVIYANSITLTPGTVSIDLGEQSDTVVVHSLTREGMESLMAGEMLRRVERLER